MPSGPESIPRRDFLQTRWRYRAGEHVTLLGPTGSGKTHLTWQLLQVSATPRVPAVVLAMKPRDATTTKWSKTLGYRVTRQWPPARLPFRAKPSGYTLWPRHTFDPDIDDAEHERIFRKAVMDSYRNGDRIVVCDELLAAMDLHLERSLRAGWTRGRSMGMGLWGGTQKPTHIPTYGYNQASHLFIAYDPDKRSRDRFNEIGGLDSDLLRNWVCALGKHEFLYIRRDGPAICVVEK